MKTHFLLLSPTHSYIHKHQNKYSNKMMSTKVKTDEISMSVYIFVVRHPIENVS